MAINPNSKVAKIQVWPGRGGWYWHARARNHAIIIASGEALSRRERVISFVAVEFPHAKVEILDKRRGEVVEVVEPLVNA